MSLIIIGDWKVDLEGRTIVSLDDAAADGMVTQLEPRAAEVLAYLIVHRGQVVSKAELLSEVWGRPVTDNAIMRVINILRKAFDDSVREPRYIETIAKKGYRLIAEVVEEQPPRPQPAPPVYHQRILLAVIASAGLLLVIGLLVRTEPEQPILRPYPLTAMEGAEKDPDLSADGRFLTFVHRADSDAYWQVYIKDLSNQQVRQVTAGDYHHAVPRWWRDGHSLIVYRRGDHHCDVLMVTLEALQQQRLFDCSPDNFNIDIQPDYRNRQIYIAAVPGINQPYQIRRYHLDDASWAEITKPAVVNGFGDYAMRLDINREQLFFLRNSGNGTEFWRQPLAGGEAQQLFSIPHVIVHFGLDRSRRHLIYRGTSGQLLKRSLDDQSERPLVIADTRIDAPVVAADGSLLALQGDSLYDREIRLLAWDDGADAETTSVKRVIGSSYADALARVNPGSGDIAFVSTRSGLPQLWLSPVEELPGNADTAQASSRGAIQLTEFDQEYLIETLAWSADGNMLLTVLNGKAYVHDLVSQQSRQVNLNTPSVNFPEWLQDEPGSMLYSALVDGGWQLFKRDVQGRAAQLTTQGGYRGRRCGPDQQMVFSRRRQERGLWTMNEAPTAGESRLLIADASARVWTCDDRHLYYVIIADGEVAVHQYDLRDGQSRRLYVISDTYSIYDLAVGATATQLWMTVEIPQSTNILGANLAR